MPAPQLVTWRGTFFSCEGQPVPGGLVLAHADPGPGGALPAERSRAVCDEAGRFELGGLEPGRRYRTRLWLEERSVAVEGEAITFDLPGVVERDVRLEGGRLSGVVVVRRSGDPLGGEGGHVTAIGSSPPFRGFTGKIGADGRFRLPCVPAGIYQLSSSIEGRPSARRTGVVLEEGGSVDNLRLEVPAGGELHVRLAGFEQDAGRRFQLRTKLAGGPRGTWGYQNVGDAGTWERRYPLSVGEWSVSLVFDELGTVERELVIVEAQTTELVVWRDELDVSLDAVAVEGSLRRASGAPITEASLFFYGFEVVGLDDSARGRSARTDAEGRFAATGFLPGRWSVSANLSGGGEPIFPDLIVPPRASDPLALHLVLPDGVVRGGLHDDLTGAPFGETEPTWWVFLLDARSDSLVQELQGGHRGREFTLVGVAPGDYRLRVVARGYEDLLTELFALAEGQELDLAPLRLKPAGVLDLAVEDRDGHPITAFELVCNGVPNPAYTREALPDGRARVHKLPLGRVTLRVSAPGYTDRELTLELAPGTPGEARVELQPGKGH